MIYQIDNFLGQGLSDRYLRTIFMLKDSFIPAAVSTLEEEHESDYRRSLVHHNPFFKESFSQIIANNVADATQQFNIPNPSYRDINVELQVTAHGNDCYYKVHNDNGSADTTHRILTYVYYLHRQPKSFTGGELKVYGEQTITVQPTHNTLVFFPSHIMHEVLPVNCGEDFTDSRFTVNGWIRF